MFVRKRILSALMMACLIGILGCQSEQEAPVEETSRPETTSQPETPPRVDEPADPKANLQETLKNQYDKLEQNIQGLQNKAEAIPAERKEEFNQMMQSLQIRKEVAKERLDALGSSASEGWETLKNSTEEALNNLQNTYDKLAAQFP